MRESRGSSAATGTSAAVAAAGAQDRGRRRARARGRGRRRPVAGLRACPPGQRLLTMSAWQFVVVQHAARRIAAPDRADDASIPTADDLDVAGFVDAWVARMRPDVRRDFGRFLAYIEHLAPLRGGLASRFTRLDADAQDRVLAATRGVFERPASRGLRRPQVARAHGVLPRRAHVGNRRLRRPAGRPPAGRLARRAVSGGVVLGRDLDARRGPRRRRRGRRDRGRRIRGAPRARARRARRRRPRRGRVLAAARLQPARRPDAAAPLPGGRGPRDRRHGASASCRGAAWAAAPCTTRTSASGRRTRSSTSGLASTGSSAPGVDDLRAGLRGDRARPVGVARSPRRCATPTTTFCAPAARRSAGAAARSSTTASAASRAASASSAAPTTRSRTRSRSCSRRPSRRARASTPTSRPFGSCTTAPG